MLNEDPKDRTNDNQTDDASDDGLDHLTDEQEDKLREESLDLGDWDFGSPNYTSGGSGSSEDPTDRPNDEQSDDASDDGLDHLTDKQKDQLRENPLDLGDWDFDPPDFGEERGTLTDTEHPEPPSEQALDRRDDFADRVGIDPQNVALDDGDIDIDETRRRMARDEIIDQGGWIYGEDDIASVEEVDDGQYRPVFTDEFQRSMARGQIAADTDLERDDIAAVEEVDGGYRPVLTDAATEERVIQQLDDRSLIFGSDDIASVEEVDDGQFVPEFTEDFQERMAIGQLTDETDIKIDDIEEVDVTGDGIDVELTAQAGKKRAAEAIAADTILGAEQIEVEEVDDGKYVGRASEEVIEEIESQLKDDRHTVPDDVRQIATDDSFEDLDTGAVYPAAQQETLAPGAGVQLGDGQLGAIDTATDIGVEIGEEIADTPIIGEGVDIAQDIKEDISDRLLLSSDDPESFEFDDPEIEAQVQSQVEPKLEEEFGVDLDAEEDIVIQEGDEDGEFVARLSPEGEETVAVETAPLADQPIVGRLTRTGASLRQDELRFTDPYAEAFEDRTPDRGDISNVIGDVVPDKATAATGALGVTGVGVKTGTGVTAATGTTAAAGTGVGALIGVSAATGIGFASARVDDIEVEAAAPTEVGIGTGIVEQELDPEIDPTQTTELQPEEAAAFVGELSQPEDISPAATEVGVPTGTLFEPELGITEQQTDVDVEGTFTEDTVVPDEFPLAGRDMPADPRREFVTGESGEAVAGTSPVTEGQLREEEDKLGVPDDPFLESDRRLYDPRREFGETEDAATYVDRTSDEFLSDDDIGSGIAGSGQAFEPAHGETVEESFRRWMQQEEQMLEEAQTPELWKDYESIGEVEDTALLESELTQEAGQLEITQLLEQARIRPRSRTEPPAFVGPDIIQDADEQGSGTTEERGDVIEDVFEETKMIEDSIGDLGVQQTEQLSEPLDVVGQDLTHVTEQQFEQGFNTETAFGPQVSTTEINVSDIATETTTVQTDQHRLLDLPDIPFGGDDDDIFDPMAEGAEARRVRELPDPMEDFVGDDLDLGDPL